MKKGIIFLITIIILFSTMLGIIANINNKEKIENGKITIVATLFPQYDFAKQIGGDKVNVSLLLTPGTETHTYEPTPQDIIKVNNSDLFIYTGKYMEPWSDKIASSITSNTVILDASKNINLINEEEFENAHNAENGNIEEQHEDIIHNHNEEKHEHEYDPHIWLDPQNAIKMVESITQELCNIDSKNADYYKENSKNYIEQINKLDEEIENTIKNSNKNKIAFGGTFAYAYFVNRYNINFISAYDSCGEDTEPSVSKLKSVIDYIKENDIKVVFYQELSSGKIADTISKETGAEKLVFHTIHNASQEEINNNETYISLMNKNLKNLKRALE